MKYFNMKKKFYVKQKSGKYYVMRRRFIFDECISEHIEEDYAAFLCQWLNTGQYPRLLYAEYNEGYHCQLGTIIHPSINLSFRTDVSSRASIPFLAMRDEDFEFEQLCAQELVDHINEYLITRQ